MRWLITGGCGFIGTSLIAALEAEGNHAIRVIDNLTVGSAAALAGVGSVHRLDAATLRPLGRGGNAGVELVVGDILDAGLLIRAAAGADVLVHLAASTGVQQSLDDPMSDCRANVEGTLNALLAARTARVERFVFASSGAPLGAADPPIHERLAARPMSPYGASKLAGEGYCSAFAHGFGLATVALRFSNVYGPRSSHKGSVVAKFVRRALAAEPLELFGDGGQTRDFIYIDDLVRAIRLAATVPGIAGELFQIATSRETSVGELADTLVPILRDAGVTNVAVRHAPPLAGEMRRNFADTTKARDRLGWSAEVGLAEGLRRTVRWYLDRPAG
ncbi:MAG: NAD-dependent epimerase/dehydratase family protein [Alphaproteobacteria bacterium]|nr:NAD-dependent epimerase/dehydratase family protein [Alphaproteobacteria bacterium]